MRAVFLLLNFAPKTNVNYRAVTSLRQMTFLGEPVTLLGGVPNPVTLFGQFAVVLVLVFVADASLTIWRRGDRRKALMIGGSVAFFLLAGLVASAAVFWLNFRAPLATSVLYLGVVAVMGYELSRDVLRASQLVQELQASEAGLRESEARMNLAVDAADFGIWIRDLEHDQIWASAKWRELFGFSASEAVDFDSIRKRLHPDDRDGLQQAQADAIASSQGGTDRGRYQTEFRLVLPDGECRWISSRGRVECDAGGRPVLIRGASREITASKHAELALRDLSGRLIAAQEVERARIARDLHDDVSQQLAGLSIALSGLKRHAAAVVDSPDLQKDVSSLQQRTNALANSVRDLSHDLHPDVLRHVGLASSLTAYCGDLSLSQALEVSCNAEGDFESLNPEAALCLYRIAQEALRNVVKHAEASRAEVRLSQNGDTAELIVADNGRGFDIEVHRHGSGLGLVSIAERVRLAGGTVSVVTVINQGTKIRVLLPITYTTSEDDVPGRVATSA
jgi:PAS domain S-box-containing protein